MVVDIMLVELMLLKTMLLEVVGELPVGMIMGLTSSHPAEISVPLVP